MTPIQYNNFDGLLNMGVSNHLLLNNELSACKNCYNYQIGKLEKVPGYSKAGTTFITENRNVLHLHFNTEPTTSDGYQPYLYGISTPTSGLNPVMKYIAPNLGSPITTWTDITLTSDWNSWGVSTAKFSSVSFLNKTFYAGFNTSNSAYLTPATVEINALDVPIFVTDPATDSDLLDMPKGKFIVKYRDLLYVLNTNSNKTRAYYCDEISSGSIGWTVATRFEEFGYQDGQEITGAGVAIDKLVVFKERSMYTYDESRIRKIADIGCDSHNSILNINGILYWFNRQGIWRWNGGKPQLISNKIQPFINAIDQTTLLDTQAVKYAFEYRLFVGDVTINDDTYTNTWICFDTRREKFYIRCTYHDCMSATLFVDDDVQRAYFGSTGADGGYVYKFAEKVDEVFDDDGEEIDSFFITKNFDYGVPQDKNLVNGITIFSENNQGMKLVIDTDNKNQFSDASIQILKKNVEYKPLNVTGHRMRYKFYEKGDGKSWEFDGFVIFADTKERDNK